MNDERSPPEGNGTMHERGGAPPLRLPRSRMLRSRMPRSLLPAWLALLALALAVLPARTLALNIEGHVYEDTVVVEREPLRLNGAGVRTQLWLKAFTAALYVPQPAQQADGVLEQPGAKRLRVRLLIDVPSHEFTKALYRGVARNHGPDEQAALADRVQRLATLVDGIGALHKGDTVDVDYCPGRGVVLRLNGEVHGEPLAGGDFYRALLRIFIGERPVQGALKTALLGGGDGGGNDGADGAGRRGAAAP